MNDIAGTPENAFNIEGGFTALQGVAGQIQVLLKDVVCHPCKRFKVSDISVQELLAAMLKKNLSENQTNGSEENAAEENASAENAAEENASAENAAEENASEA